MFWKKEKLAARIQELAEYRYRDIIPIPPLKYKLDEKGEVGTRPPRDAEWSTIQVGDYWTGRDIYAWMQTEINIPEKWHDREIVGLFDFGKTGGGNNSGFESLLYINGQPYQGVDSNHQEVFLTGDSAGTKVELTFRLWSGLEGGGEPTQQEHKIKRADLAWLDKSTDNLYFTAEAMSQTAEILGENSPERHSLLTALDRAFLQIDWSCPGSESFYESIVSAERVLEAELKQAKKQHPVTIRAIGHTHIDVAWLWRLKHTREKAARSFSTVLRLMEKFPEYVFLQTQPQLYDYIKTDYPEIYEQIQARVKEGSWETDGGMWLEADCNVTSGESLVRQLLMGTRFFRKEFGTECTYLWLPDVFGYSWALPQILKKSGIDTFMTTKISWNQYNRMPHDTFKWRGIDGTEVLTHFITTPTPDQNHLGFYTYNGEILPKTVQGSWDAYQDKAVNNELLLSYGYGDGGGGVNRKMLEMRRRLNDMPGLPTVETGRADDYFKRLNERVENTDQYVHTWDGELYLEYHRGTYTSQAYNKKMNRKLELLYRETEWLGVLSSVIGADWSMYPQSELNDGWKIILRNQFHDIIPGSSIREVYEDSHEEYKQAEELAFTARSNALSPMVSDQATHHFTVMNSAPWKQSGIARVPAKPGMENGIWKNAKGTELKAVRSDREWLVNMDSLPSMGFAPLQFVSTETSTEREQPVPFDLHEDGVETPYYAIRWNTEGQLVELYDRAAERDVLASGGKGNILQVFEDKPMNFDAWDIDIYYQEKMREVRQLNELSVSEVNSMRVVVHCKWEYMDSTIEQDMILYADNPRIDFETNVDWHEQHQLLKVAFPVAIRSTEATYDIQYGNVRRPTHWNTSWDYARFETVGHQWADLSEQGYGVSLLNDCKYGYDIKDNVIRLSLIKSATAPDYQQDQGKHEFTYSLLPHQGDWVQGDTVKHAWVLNNPVICAEGKSTDSDFSLFHLSVDNVMVDSVKKAEDENKIVLRLHEFTGRRGPVHIQSDFSILSWQECDLMERPVEDESKQKDLQFNINPYEIKTFLIKLTKDEAQKTK